MIRTSQTDRAILRFNMHGIIIRSTPILGQNDDRRRRIGGPNVIVELHFDSLIRKNKARVLPFTDNAKKIAKLRSFGRHRPRFGPWII